MEVNASLLPSRLATVERAAPIADDVATTTQVAEQSGGGDGTTTTTEDSAIVVRDLEHSTAPAASDARTEDDAAVVLLGDAAVASTPCEWTSAAAMAQTYTIKELREFANARGVPSHGKKMEICERLMTLTAGQA